MNGLRLFVIVGIGNCLLTDDGVGVHAVRCLAKDPPPRTIVVDAGTDFLSVIPFLEQSRRVLAIDAMDVGGPPGTIYRCHGANLAAPVGPHSLHELGLQAMLEFLDPSRRPSIHVLGIQPASLDYGLALSPGVAAVLPAVVAAARGIITEFVSVPVAPSDWVSDR
jgi:hydrogenase maturation protease